MDVRSFSWEIPESLTTWPFQGAASKLAMAAIWNLAGRKVGMAEVGPARLARFFYRSERSGRHWLETLERESLVHRIGLVDGTYWIDVRDPNQVALERTEMLSVHGQGVADHRFSRPDRPVTHLAGYLRWSIPSCLFDWPRLSACHIWAMAWLWNRAGRSPATVIVSANELAGCLGRQGSRSGLQWLARLNEEGLAEVHSGRNELLTIVVRDPDEVCRVRLAAN
ncbi:MAG: hypothetical protein HQ581_17555 [Planctomycetes bacterium]|nr:hypothetical protein [Planctomycetota bacterium]